MSNIKITRLTINTIFLTLYEKVTISDPKYLFSFKTLDKTVNFIAQDLQTTAMLLEGARNKFSIQEVASGSESLLLGIVNLEPEGQWNYKIYAQTSTTNVDPTLANELIEEGICFVKGTAVATFNTYDDQPLLTKFYTP
jgi:hypothetical protein